MNIIIADDERDSVEYLKERLVMKGHNVEGVYDGEAALELLKSGKYDILFMDYNMPEKNGLELAKYAKANNIRTKMVMITGYEDMEGFFAREIGVNEYLTKPIKIKDVEDIINKYNKETPG